MFFEIPTPPVTIRAPVVLEEASVADITLATAPTFRFSWVLIPPATLSAPVVAEVEVVVSVMVTLSASTSSKLACKA